MAGASSWSATMRRTGRAGRCIRRARRSSTSCPAPWISCWSWRTASASSHCCPAWRRSCRAGSGTEQSSTSRETRCTSRAALAHGIGPAERARLFLDGGAVGPRRPRVSRLGRPGRRRPAAHNLPEKDAKGLHYIAYLLRHPGREFHVLELIGQGLEIGGWRLVEEGQRSEARDQRLETGQGLPILDGPAKAAYQQRLSALRHELDEAERNNDPGQAERAREELDAITEQLAAALGLGGRDRQAASSTERARSTVRKVVKAALNRISDHHAALGRHLTTSIKTGTFCAYAPDEPPGPWAF